MVLTHIDLKYVSLIYRKIRQKVPNGKGLMISTNNTRKLAANAKDTTKLPEMWSKIIAPRCRWLSSPMEMLELFIVLVVAEIINVYIY